MLARSRLPGTNPANFLEPRFWITSGLPTIRELIGPLNSGALIITNRD